MIDIALSQKRMLVAIDAPDDEALLELAVSLARLQSAELSALYVEDINLFHIAGLPFAQEIDRMTTAALNFDTVQISHQTRRKIQRLQQRLTDLEKHAKLTVSLKVVRGQYIPEVIAASSEVDLLLFSKKTAGRTLAKGQKNSKKSFVAPIWNIFNGSQEAENALTLAIEIAENRKADLNIIFDTQRSQDINYFKQQAKKLLMGRSINSHLFAETKNDYQGVLTQILQRGCSMIVMNADHQDSEINLKAAQLSERASCPVLLVK